MYVYSKGRLVQPSMTVIMILNKFTFIRLKQGSVSTETSNNDL